MFYVAEAFLPDVDPSTPNVLLECDGMVPYLKGYTAANSLQSLTGMQTLSYTCVGMFFARRVDDITYVVAGVSDRIFRKQATSWTLVSSISLGSVEKWRFAQQGNIVFAVSKSVPSMTCDTLTFSALAGMPQCNLIDTVGDFVMIGDTTEGTYGDSPDRWWCSALANYAGWTPSLATQSATGRLLDAPGKLTAGKKLNEDFVFYKRRGMWIGRYTGSQFIWEWSLISREIGAFCQEAVVNVGYQHYFWGEEDFYVFDGSTPRSIGEGVREYAQAQLARQHAHNIQGVFDWYRNLVIWFYPGTSSSGMPNKFIAYNVRTGKWGAGSMNIQQATIYVQDALTYDELFAGLTYDTIPDTTWDAIAYQSSGLVPLFIGSTGLLSTMTGAAMGTRIKTGLFGTDANFTKMTKVRPRFADSPDLAQLTPYRTLALGDAATAGTQRTMSNNSFCLTQVARYHQLELSTSGSEVLLGFDVDLVPAGRK